MALLAASVLAKWENLIIICHERSIMNNHPNFLQLQAAFTDVFCFNLESDFLRYFGRISLYENVLTNLLA